MSANNTFITLEIMIDLFNMLQDDKTIVILLHINVAIQRVSISIKWKLNYIKSTFRVARRQTICFGKYFVLIMHYCINIFLK